MKFFEDRRKKKEAEILEAKNKKLAEIEDFNSKQEWEPCKDASRLFKMWRYKKIAWYFTWTDTERNYPQIAKEDEHKCTILQMPCETEKCLTCAVAMRELGLNIIIQNK